MNKENIPNYHVVSCCGTCKHNKIDILPIESEAVIRSICTKYKYEVSANGCCNSFEEDNANE